MILHFYLKWLAFVNVTKNFLGNWDAICHRKSLFYTRNSVPSGITWVSDEHAERFHQEMSLRGILRLPIIIVITYYKASGNKKYLICCIM